MPNDIVHRHPQVQHIRTLTIHTTIADMEALIREVGPAIVEGRRPPIHVTVDGYTNDPRELWEIPEVRALLERVITSGLVGLLAMNFEERDPLSLGVVDVLLFSRGRGSEEGFFELDVKELVFIVEELLPAANRTVDEVLARPRS